jgi:hypothetical protein
MADPQIDPSQVMTGNFGMPQQPQQPQGQMPGGDLDSQIKQQILQQGQAGMQGYQQTQQQMGDLGQRAQALQQQLGSMPLPKTSVTDEPWMKMQPVRGQGVGGDLKNLLADIGRGMLAGVASTGPGQSIQQGLYGGGERRYQTQSGALAQQIQDIQGQQKTLGESLGPTTNLATRQGVNYGAASRGIASETRANLDKVMAPLKLELQAKGQQLQRDIADNKITQQQADMEMRKIIALHHDATLQNIGGMYADQRDRDAAAADAEQELKQLNEHPFLYMMGMGAPPPSQSATPAPGPKSTGTKPAPKNAAGAAPPKGATHIGMGPDGKKHYADAQGNDLGLVK